MSAQETDQKPQSMRACGYEFGVDRRHTRVSMSETESRPLATTAELAETALRVQLVEQPPRYTLDLGQFGAYRYDALCVQIEIMRAARNPAFEQLALRGPVLLHALAHRGIYVLHASAVQRADGVVLAITAASGVGKSTLASLACTQGWRRLADDLLPVGKGIDARLECLPQLEQPKLSRAEQYPMDGPALPLSALLLLKRGPNTGLRTLSAIDTAHLILSSTVATRAFARASLAAHLGFAAFVAEQVSGGGFAAAELTIADRADDPAAAATEALSLLRAFPLSRTNPHSKPLANSGSVDGALRTQS